MLWAVLVSGRSVDNAFVINASLSEGRAGYSEQRLLIAQHFMFCGGLSDYWFLICFHRPNQAAAPLAGRRFIGSNARNKCRLFSTFHFSNKSMAALVSGRSVDNAFVINASRLKGGWF
jgi:hypothetical protein